MVNTTTKRILLTLSLLTSCLLAEAQQFSITAGSITTCTGVLEDSGGPNGDYGDNENFTVVICADNPGDGISLNWLVADLNTAGPNNNQDRLRIWDGDNTGETFLGEYTGAGLQGLIVTATTFNTTGCLTVQFISNNVAGAGNFAASITCFTPCERPIAVASMSEAVPALICVGETVSFDGTASYPANSNFNIVSYEWDFDDGETAAGSTATHAFAVAGEYVVQLNLLDDNDCVNANVVDLQILVSTTPSFQGTVESIELCLGATVNLNAVVTPVTWTGIPDANFGDGVFLPDDVGQPFSSSLSFTQFDPGQQLTNTADLLSICVEMEHTFMGDLVLQVICPNGQTMIMHQQGGGGTYLGAPNDTDSNQNPIIGECWEYCWSPTATNGTWVANSNAGSQNTTLAGTPPAQSLDPGTYQSVQPFSNLVGCPLNGEWTYQSTDLWGADNGFICSWSINFNPAIIPDVTQFTPIVGTSSQDSAFWTGPFLTLDPLDPLVGTATPDVQGDYAYTFFATDNFGCMYDTTITVTVPPQIVLDAGPDMVLCSDPEPMAGEIVANGPPTNCLWDLVLFDGAWDGWNGGANLVVNIDGVNTTYAMPTGSNTQTYPINVQTGATITMTYTAGTIWNNENSFDLINDVGVEVYSSPNGPATGVLYTGTLVCGGGATPFFFEWTPVDGLTNPNSATSDVYVTSPTWYYLSAYPVGYPECGVVDSVLVSPDPSIDAGISNVLIMCASDPMILLTDSLGGTPDMTGVWTLSDGTVVPNLFDPLTSITDIYTYTVTSAAGCVATASLDITIIPAEDPTCCGIPDAGEPMISCDLTIALNATPGNSGAGIWDGPAGAVFADPMAAVTTVTMPTGGGGSHMFYWVENDGAFCNTIDSVLMTFTDAYVFTPTLTNALCFSYCDGAAQVGVTGGNAAAGLNFEWSTGEQGVDLDMVNGLCAGDHMLRVRDDNNCTDSLIFTITEPILLEIDSLATHPVTCSGDCDGKVEVYDMEAFLISFDDGASWGPNSELFDACEGLYPIRIQNGIGCIGTGAISVTGPPPVIAEFTWGPNPANVNDPTIRFGNLSSDAIRYFWNIDDLATSTEVNPTFTFSEKEPGIYEVCLVAYNFNDCADTICHNVIIDDVLFTYIPNSFTPDGDGVNDFWGMSANIPVMTDFEMMVFDRWGQVVYSTDNPYKPWFGSYQNGGEILKSDVYAYRILYAIEGTEARKEIVGHVTLLK